MQEKKTPIMITTILVVICFSLFFYGLANVKFSWFFGQKLVVSLALFSILLNQSGNKNGLLKKSLVNGIAGVTVIMGAHLLSPYFWAVRVQEGMFLTAFIVAGGLAWVYSIYGVYADVTNCNSYKLFACLPVAVFIGGMLAVNVFLGTTYAAWLMDLYYLALAFVLLKEGIKLKKRLRFNCGLIIVMLVLGFGIFLDYMQSEKIIENSVLGALIFVASANFFYKGEKRKLRRKK